MARQWTSKSQVSGYRFLLQRTRHSLVRRDSKMLLDPMKSQNRSFFVGLVIAIIIAGVAGALALIRPQGTTGNENIYITKEDGTIYVKLGEKIHPTLNLASARLLVGNPENPRTISISKLKDFPRGPIVGIAGAPLSINNKLIEKPVWTSCEKFEFGNDTSGKYRILVAGDVDLNSDMKKVQQNQAIYAKSDLDYFLIYNGTKTKIPSNVRRTVLSEFNLSGQEAVKINNSVLNTIPSNKDLEIPYVPNSGEKTSLELGQSESLKIVSTVFYTKNTEGKKTYYILLKNNIQQIPQMAAKLIMADQKNSDLKEPVLLANTDFLNIVPESNELDVSYLPNDELTQNIENNNQAFIGQNIYTTICSKINENESNKNEIFYGIMPENILEKSLDLVPSLNGVSNSIDKFYLPQGQAALVKVALSSNETQNGFGPYFYISELGIKYLIPTPDDLKSLGFVSNPIQISNSIIDLLESGPNLSAANAKVIHSNVEENIENNKAENID